MRTAKERRRAWGSFTVGLGYLAFLAWMVCAITQHRFLIVFPAVVLAAAVCCGLLLVWLTLWAIGPECSSSTAITSQLRRLT